MEKNETAMTVKKGDITKESEKLSPTKGTGDPGAATPTDDNTTCHSCGKPVKGGVKFCTSCGVPIDTTQQRVIPICPRCGAPMVLGFCMVCSRAFVVNENPHAGICPHCGGPLGENARFCRYCGKKT